MPYYNLGIASTISLLRKSYWDPRYNVFPGDDDHAKIIATHFDYILSAIERTFCYCPSFEFFSKLRLFQFLGISSGFAFTTDQLI